MNSGLITGLAVGGAGLAVGTTAALLDKPKPVPPLKPDEVTNAFRDQKTASNVMVGMLCATMLTGLGATAMLMSAGKGFTISPTVMGILGGATLGMGAATAATIGTLMLTSKTDLN